MDAIGVVVNPIAGMGGRVGLKGTDGTLEEARRRGGTPRAPARAREALRVLYRRAPELTVYTAAGIMGEDATRDAGFDPHILWEPANNGGYTDPVAATTDAEDTAAAVRAFLDHEVDLVLFVGGDGTAVDVAAVLEAHEGETPMLGVPAGVKIYSSVFAVTPKEAGRIAATFDRIESREVNDIDEAAYREGTVRTELKAVVPVPVSPAMQSSKQRAEGTVETLAAGFAKEIEPETTYIFGPGSTVGRIETELGVDPSPLGVDVWRDGTLLARDATETEILEVLSEPAVIVVSPIGGQGFIFGRGNHQLSPAVIARCDLEVVASSEKLDQLDSLRVDTDDEEINDDLRGWLQVRTGRFTTRLVPVV